MWLCLCACGKEKGVAAGCLRSGATQSCGCLNRERTTARITAFNRKHGETGVRLYRIWSGLLARCLNPKRASYPRYGGRGIRVCPEWRIYEAFAAWAKAHGYRDELEIDRIDNNGHYTPENCRFVTHRVNCNNKNDTRKPVCKRGHPFDERNTRHKNGKRHCRTCTREAMRDRRLRKKLQEALEPQML